jgi:AraC-like DNA-binding protein
MLKEERAPLGDLAERLGYESEAAFSRAFKRILGVAPGAMRRGGESVNASNGQLTARPIG